MYDRANRLKAKLPGVSKQPMINDVPVFEENTEV